MDKKGKWSVAGFVIGFSTGYLLFDSLVSGIVLGIGMLLALGLGGKTEPSDKA